MQGGAPKTQPDMERWERLHTDPRARAALDDALRDAWRRSAAAGIDYQTALPAEVSHNGFKRAKQQSKRLYIYASSIVNASELDPEEEYGVMLFDTGGCLLRLYGGARFRAWAAANHIGVATRWTEEAIGVNVVSLGTQLQKTVQLCGEENFAHFLTPGRYAYTPVKLEDGVMLGGLAMAASLQSSMVNLDQILDRIVRGIELQFFWFSTILWYGNQGEGTGMLVLDQSNGQNRVLVLSDEIKRILGLPDEDYFYDLIETIIDPPPANQLFWEIVETKREVFDQTIPLTIHGRRVVINASTVRHKEEKFHMHGIGFNVSSLKRINKLVSKYAGNEARYSFQNIIGDSEVMKNTVQHAKDLSQSDSNILIQGESGVGKDIFAQAIHNNSSRSDKPFVALNCAALSKELITSELFGYESGAFTGAKKEGTVGKFELANGGSLFLDEIGDMPLDLQAVLLRVVEEKNFRRVGGNEIVQVDVRIIAATNQPLQQKIEQGRFREDLYYRLATLRLNIPPLRKRGDDIFLLADTFVDQIALRLNKTPATFSPGARLFMKSYRWHGNVRELQNLLEGIISTHNGPVIEEHTIREFLDDRTSGYGEGAPSDFSLPHDDETFAKTEIEQAIKICRGNKAKAAKRLGVSRSTLYRWIEKYDIN